MKFFGPVTKAAFVSRPNRFTLLCELEGKVVKAYLPNPGRLQELARLASNRTRSAVLFVIHWPEAEVFMPDFHTDLEFARTLLAVRDRVAFIPATVKWRDDLSINPSETKVVDILWEAVDEEAHDQGSYLVIFRLPEKKRIRVGELGEFSLAGGYYIYVGSAKRGLSARINRHRRLRKNRFWHIDYLSAQAQFHAALPIRSSDDLECDIAAALHAISEGSVPGFGSSDCACPSHLFWSREDPLHSPRFHLFLQYCRMERLVDRYGGSTHSSHI